MNRADVVQLQVAHLETGQVEYRLEPGGPATVLMLHGGHLSAGVPLGEDVFRSAGCAVLAVSRPGYGRTPVTSGTSPDDFAGVIAELCQTLKIDRLAAVVGQSAGGPTAISLAAQNPVLVERLILECSVGLRPWPPPRTRRAAVIAFRPGLERFTWAAVRFLLRTAPDLALRTLLADLTVRPAGSVLSELTANRRADMIDLFTRMRSGAGFLNDLRHLSDAEATNRCEEQCRQIRQPTLIIATRNDGAVSFDHAESLAGAIPHARLTTPDAPTHLIWYSDSYPATTTTIREALLAAQ
jgi:pimeloyl-ACP methyl ester carboxylesterase